MSKFKVPQTDDNKQDTKETISSQGVSQTPQKQDTRETRVIRSKTISGEILPKSDKIFACIGTLEELVSYIGVVKAEHFNTVRKTGDIVPSTKLMLFAKLTSIQEKLLLIIRSISTVKKEKTIAAAILAENVKTVSQENIDDLETEIKGYEKIYANKSYNITDIIPGTTLLEAHLHHCRAVCRRAERHIVCMKHISDIEVRYINIVSKYFTALAIGLLVASSQEPLLCVK